MIRTFCLLSVIQFIVSWQLSLFSLLNYPSQANLAWQIQGQRKSIERRIAQGGAYWQHIFQPEGMLFVYAFYSYALVGLTLRHADNAQLREDVLHQLEGLIPRAEQAFSQFPFSYCDKMNPRGGVIAAGNANLMRAGYVIAGGKSQDIINRFHIGSKELFDCYSSSPLPVLQSFPHMGERWCVDNCSAVESLRLHDRIFGTKYFESTSRFTRFVTTDLDKPSGMTNAGVNEDGSRADVPRGCALSWSLAMMPGFMPDFARKQYELYRHNWFVPVLGMLGIREWWSGEENFSKINEGPVVFGVGAAASGLGIVTTQVQNDRDAWLGLNRGLESIGFPSWNLLGEKSYFGELFLLADVISLWGKTACVWDDPDLSGQTLPNDRHNWPDLNLGLFFVPLCLSVLISAALLALASILWWRSFSACRSRGLKGMDKSERFWLLAQALMLLIEVVLPMVLWTIPFVVMLIMRLTERWQLKVRELRYI